MSKLYGIGFVFFIFFSLAAFGFDPNLDSYQKSGECSDMNSENRCGECPLKKKFVSLPQNSKPQTPKEAVREFNDFKSEKGQR